MDRIITNDDLLFNDRVNSLPCSHHFSYLVSDHVVTYVQYIIIGLEVVLFVHSQWFLGLGSHRLDDDGLQLKLYYLHSSELFNHILRY
jgi:hypothetical protein